MNTTDKELSMVLNWQIEEYSHTLKFSLDRLGLYIHQMAKKGNEYETPDSLYKFYSNSDKNLESLEEGYLYFSSPRNFNDPFDCLTNRESCILKGGEGIKNHRDNLGLCCFSTINDNTLMWGHYTNQYKGFCVKFKNDDLLKNNHISIRTFVSYLKDYKPSYKSFDKVANDVRKLNSISEDIKNLILKGLTFIHNYTWKSYDWNYEKEFRAISWTSEKFNRKYSFDRNLFEEIYIGYKMKDIEPVFYKKLINILNEKYPNCKIFEVSPHPVVVKLKFNEIIKSK